MSRATGAERFPMPSLLRAVAMAWFVLAPAAAASASGACFPPPGGWGVMSPREASFDPAELQAAVEFAAVLESLAP